MKSSRSGRTRRRIRNQDPQEPARLLGSSEALFFIETRVRSLLHPQPHGVLDHSESVAPGDEDDHVACFEGSAYERAPVFVEQIDLAPTASHNQYLARPDDRARQR